MDSRYNDWNLIIVGYGQDEGLYRNYVNDHNLKRVSFIGKQDPKQFYIDSSIFMMTSEFEGLALTLVEAQNFGCVPIAFDSFSSISDIISHKRNGIIIYNNNISMYIEWLKKMMDDNRFLQEMATYAMIDARKFSIAKISNDWISFFKLGLQIN